MNRAYLLIVGLCLAATITAGCNDGDGPNGSGGGGGEATCPAIPHGTATPLSNGECQFTSCDPGWLNCDVDVMNGCESDLTANDNCGACGVVCSASDVCRDPDLMGYRCVPTMCPSSTCDVTGQPCLCGATVGTCNVTSGVLFCCIESDGGPCGP